MLKGVFTRSAASFAVFAVASLAVSSAQTYGASLSDKTVLKSALSIDYNKHTVTLPLYHGVHDGKSVWYIITDASDVSAAKKLHVVFSPAMANLGESALQHVTKRGGDYAFEGVPDFSKVRTYVGGKAGFPPTSATPGAIGDSNYSPFVRIDGIPGVLNAPIVATGDGAFDVTRHTNTQDSVVGIDAAAKTVTLFMVRGYVDSKPVDYLSTETSDAALASAARATYAPKLKTANSAGTMPIGVVVNGPRDAAGQGLVYYALDTPLGIDATPSNVSSIGSPFNILASAPNLDNPYAPNAYSPLWEVYIVPKGPPMRIKNYATFASLNPQKSGLLVNCPVVTFE